MHSGSSFAYLATKRVPMNEMITGITHEIHSVFVSRKSRMSHLILTNASGAVYFCTSFFVLAGCFVQ